MRAAGNQAAHDLMNLVYPIILLNIKLVADPDEGSIVMATDLEVGVRYRVLGVKVDQPGSAVLPTSRMGSILRTSTDE